MAKKLDPRFHANPQWVKRLDAAKKKEREYRARPFLREASLKLCGVVVKQFTLRHLTYLHAAGCCFVAGGDPTAEHVAVFLWICSPCFSIDKKERQSFIRSIVNVSFLKSCDEINAYLNDALFDIPRGASQGVPIASFEAQIIHEIASAYGWGANQILDTPMAELLQYVRMIDRDWQAKAGKKPITSNPLSDAVMSDFLAEFMKEAQARG